MDLMVNIDIKRPSRQINYREKILLIGSCFTEHIGNSLEELKFSVLQNPNGILFDAYSVCNALLSYIQNKKFTERDFFQLNDAWHSWRYHSRYSHVDLKEAVRLVNESQENAHHFLKDTTWIIITLGSAFSYRLTNQTVKTADLLMASSDLELGVSNCHRAPAQWFTKHLMSIDEIISSLNDCLRKLFEFNPRANVIFTVSPVRHIRDGVVDNNRSKARLIESVHQVAAQSDKLYYFPAYELVIDVLRDYRFYDIDLVHPNYMATEFVLEKFTAAYIDEYSRNLMEEVKSVVTARKHKALQPATNAHKQFLQSQLEKTKKLCRAYPFLNLQDELTYFQS